MRMEQVPFHAGAPLADRSQQLRAVWLWTLEPLERATPHQHPDGEEVYMVLQGLGKLVVGDQILEVPAGQAAHVPAGTSHYLDNPGNEVLRALSVETYSTSEVQTARSTGDIDGVMSSLPERVDEAAAIQAIVGLFDIGGSLSEQIEGSLGLDNEEGRDALHKVERRIMRAVLAIAQRYDSSSSGSMGHGRKRI